MPQDDLEPLAPQDALDWYLEHRRDSLRTATRRKHTSALGTFVDWTDEVDIDDMNDVGGRELMRFKTWRKNETDLAVVSLNGNLAILRRFLRFCERIDAVAEGVADRVPLPNVPPDEEVNTDVPENDEVEGIRSYFRQFEYASRRHVKFELIAEIGLRMGAIRAIDLDDFDREELVIHLRHRPEETEDYGTPLKNGSDGERIVNISAELRDFLVDYVEYNRHDVVDEYGRDALFTTSAGHVSTATIRRDSRERSEREVGEETRRTKCGECTRRNFHKMTRPCEYSADCPHDREVAICEAAKKSNASECPSGFTTHPLRKWAIMNQLDAGMPKELLSDRVDVPVPVLDKHYDQRTEEQKSRRRLEELEKHLAEYSDA